LNPEAGRAAAASAEHAFARLSELFRPLGEGADAREPEGGEAPPPAPPASEADETATDEGVLTTLEVADADADAAFLDDDVGGATGTDALAEKLARASPFAPGSDADGSPRAAGPESAASTSSVPPAAAVSDHREPEPETSEGYWNARGEWQLGAFPGGFYDETTGAWKSGFYDSEGVFTEGYYDDEGAWTPGQPPTGYWNERGEWTTGAFPGGYADATRGWLRGYFTEDGAFVEGYYASDGSWIAGQPENGGATGGEGEMMDVPL
jgi:hypothetical protein